MGFGFISPVVNSTPPVVVPMEQNATVVNFSTSAVVVPARKKDGMGHQSSVVVSPQPRRSNQFADVLNNGVVTINSSDQCPKSKKWISYNIIKIHRAVQPSFVGKSRMSFRSQLPTKFLNL